MKKINTCSTWRVIDAKPITTTIARLQPWRASAMRLLAPGLLVCATAPLAAAQVRGDFNGDGRSDLAIGTPNARVNGTSQAGEVTIIYGTARGLDTRIVQTLNQDSAGMPGGAEVSDHFGAALATGDFNDDGYDDLVIGVPNEDVVDSDDGAVHILYGTFLGLSPSGSQMLWESEIGLISENADQFGEVLATGDINGDGYDDLVVGVPYEDVGSVYNAGAVDILFGSSSGLRTSGVLRLHQESTDVSGDSQRWDKFGASLAVGDFDDDGFADIAAGVPNESVSGFSYAGAVAVLYGAASGPSGARDALWHRGDAYVEGDLQANAYFGWAVSAGDFDGDDYYDLAIGAPGSTHSGHASAGSVNVLMGSSVGITATGDHLWHQDSPGIDGACEANDAFGRALTVGNFNGDNRDDLAIGVIGEDVDGFVDAGMVHVLLGSSGGLTYAGSQIWHQGISGVEGGRELADRFGTTLAAGDFNGDGRDDLAVGVPEEDLDGLINAGAVNVLYAGTSGLSSSGDVMISRSSGSIPGDTVYREEFGRGLAPRS